MALVPRTLEARGLDATPQIQAKLRQVGTPAALRAVEILDIILRDEVGHVAIGNHWYRWLCEREGLDPVAHYGVLAQRYEAPRLDPPFNESARGAPGSPKRNWPGSAGTRVPRRRRQQPERQRRQPPAARAMRAEHRLVGLHARAAARPRPPAPVSHCISATPRNIAMVKTAIARPVICGR